MIIDDASDPVLRTVRQLEVLMPDPRRAARLRTRCRTQVRRPSKGESRFGRALFTGLCVVYLCALVLDVLRWEGVL